MTDRTNDALFTRGQAVMPGGVNSPVRSFRSVGGTPYFVDRAEGAHVWDVEGTRYIDYVQSYGPGILGHAHPEVINAVVETAKDGLSFGAPCVLETQIAEKICSMVPHELLEKVKKEEGC